MPYLNLGVAEFEYEFFLSLTQSRKGAKIFLASWRASRYNGGNPPPGSPVAYGGKPAYSTGSPQRAGLALRETFHNL